MELGNLKYLFLIWLIPLLIMLYVHSFKVKDRLIDKFCSLGLYARLIPKEIRGRQKLKSFLLILSVLFITIAMMQPRWGFKLKEIKRKGVDIMIAVDVSGSMLAEDVKPNRLERAKREISNLLKMLEGDRIGLIAFAGTSFVQSPLTLDYGAVQMFLDHLDTDLIPVPGTALAMAIEIGVNSFNTARPDGESEKKRSKALILITDGEDHEGDLVKAYQKAKKEGVRIFAIGIGKKGGSLIPDAKGGFKKNDQGELIVTKVDEEILQKIALETGGIYVRSVAGNLDLEQIYLENIRKTMEKREFKGITRKIREERFQWFLLAALFLLSVELLIGERRKRA